MMSGHSANPIFFDKKIKTGRSDKYHFCLAPQPNPPQSGRHMCITPNSIDGF